MLLEFLEVKVSLYIPMVEVNLTHKLPNLQMLELCGLIQMPSLQTFCHFLNATP